MATKDSKEAQEDALFKSYQAKFASNDLAGAVEDLDKWLEITDIKAFVSSLKVDVLIQMNLRSEALDAATSGLRYPNPNSQLYKQHADLLFTQARNTDDLSTALHSIDTAINLYNSEVVGEDINQGFQDADTFKYWFDNKTRTRTEMTSLRSDIKSLINSTQVYERVQEVESSINQDKFKVFETMALFTAVIALIFANTQFLQQKNINEILTLEISLILGITWIIYLTQRVLKGKSILPVPDANSFGRILGFILVFLLVMLCFSVICFGILITTNAMIDFIMHRFLKG